jgi:hypothetical protein
MASYPRRLHTYHREDLKTRSVMTFPWGTAKSWIVLESRAVVRTRYNRMRHTTVIAIPIRSVFIYDVWKVSSIHRWSYCSGQAILHWVAVELQAFLLWTENTAWRHVVLGTKWTCTSVVMTVMFTISG